MKPGRVKGDKYDPKYARQLRKGLRRNGASINKLCQMWDICRTTYNYWIEIHPDFADAVEYGKRDYIVYLEDLAMDVARGDLKGNAGVMIFSLKNAEGLWWKDQVEVTNTGLEQIQRININVLPSPEQKPLLIEHEDVDLDS